MFRLICFLLLLFTTFPAHAETAYERVMRTGKIRCGYNFYPTFLEVDPDGSGIKGIYADILKEISKHLNLDLVWSEESSTATMLQSLNNKRFDVQCSGALDHPARAREALLIPVFYTTTNVYICKDSKEFSTYDDLNNSGVTFATIDGEISALLAKQFFPKAKTFSLPDLSSAADLMLTVSSGKADAFIHDTGTVNALIEQNPGKIKKIGAGPLNKTASNLIIAKGEHDLMELMRSTVRYLNTSGFIQNKIEQYEGNSRAKIPLID